MWVRLLLVKSYKPTEIPVSSVEDRKEYHRLYYHLRVKRDNKKGEECKEKSV